VQHGQELGPPPPPPALTTLCSEPTGLRQAPARQWSCGHAREVPTPRRLPVRRPTPRPVTTPPLPAPVGRAPPEGTGTCSVRSPLGSSKQESQKHQNRSPLIGEKDAKGNREDLPEQSSAGRRTRSTERPDFLEDLHKPRLHGGEVVAGQYSALLETAPKLLLLLVTQDEPSLAWLAGVGLDPLTDWLAHRFGRPGGQDHRPILVPLQFHLQH
jgi:hypothetical protein